MTVVLHELDQKNLTLAISTIWSVTQMTVSTQKNNGFTHFCQNLAIGFVGLISPHIARQLVGGNHQGLIPVSAIWGAMIVVVADLLGRIIFAPVELPCGIVTAVIGAPYFIYLLVQTRKK